MRKNKSKGGPHLYSSSGRNSYLSLGVKPESFVRDDEPGAARGAARRRRAKSLMEQSRLECSYGRKSDRSTQRAHTYVRTAPNTIRSQPRRARCAYVAPAAGTCYYLFSPFNENNSESGGRADAEGGRTPRASDRIPTVSRTRPRAVATFIHYKTNFLTFRRASNLHIYFLAVDKKKRNSNNRISCGAEITMFFRSNRTSERSNVAAHALDVSPSCSRKPPRAGRAARAARPREFPIVCPGGNLLRGSVLRACKTYYRRREL
ncbi:hypothetical protein EVAR_64640_1 [Eumeta japonica]|uniref:Uncharacterized protein n=1 Tax=Eumeta variegata TaxID=151549 RepID=A0A4C1ZDS6_EUMVA|nr:hypothetical protein EVAR_64640_1 [Eumeta japonica]